MQVKLALLLGLGAASAAAAPCRDPKARLDEVRVAHDRVEACFGKTCWRLDLAAGTWSPVPAFEASPRGPDTVSERFEVKVCAPDKRDCHTVITPLARISDTGIQSDGDTLAAVGWEQLVRFFDVKTDKPLGTTAPWPGPDKGSYRIINVRVIGALAVMENTDQMRKTFGRLVAVRTGAVVAELAGGANLADLPPVVLGDQLAVPLRDGTALALHVLATGKQVPGPIPLFPTPGRLQLFEALADGKTAVAVREDGAVAATDGKTTRTIEPPPSCTK